MSEPWTSAREEELKSLRGEERALLHCLERYPDVFDGEDAARLEWLQSEIARREEVLPTWLKRT